MHFFLPAIRCCLNFGEDHWWLLQNTVYPSVLCVLTIVHIERLFTARLILDGRVLLHSLWCRVTRSLVSWCIWWRKPEADVPDWPYAHHIPFMINKAKNGFACGRRVMLFSYLFIFYLFFFVRNDKIFSVYGAVKLGLYVHGLVRTLGYYVLSVDHGHRQSDIFALSLFWIKRALFRTYLFPFPLRVRNNRISL